MPASRNASFSVGLVASLVAVLFGRSSREQVQRVGYSQWAANVGLKLSGDPVINWGKYVVINKVVQRAMAAQHILW